jgi:L-arabinose transport system substrate-binding protein
MRYARKGRWGAVAVAALALAAGPAACGDDDGGGTASGAAKEDLKFAYLSKQADVPYFVEQIGAAKAKAKELGVELTTQDLQLDTGLALDAMDTLISQGIDGIVIVVPDQKIGPAVIRKAEQADVPLIASDDVIEDSDGKPAPYVGLDNGAVGGQVGEELSKLFAEAAWKDDTASIGIASVELESLDVCNQRTDGARAAFLEANPEFPEDQIVSVPYDGSTGIKGPDAIGVGLDGSLACDEFKRGTSSFAASIYLDPKNEGKTAIQELYDFKTKGTPIPPRVDFPGTLITPDNVGEVVSSCK